MFADDKSAASQLPGHHLATDRQVGESASSRRDALMIIDTLLK
jgi:hypothetical protein